jgi:secreted trypsin-like serine protease
MKTFLVLFFLAAATASARRDRNDQRGEEDPSHQVRIVNGRDAPPGKYPYFAQARGDFMCGGALIAPDLIITANHCGRLGWTKGAALNTTLYNYFEDTGSINVRARRMMRMPGYDEVAQQNDIMLVKIHPPVTTITPIALNTDENAPAKDAKLVIMGYGTKGAQYNSPPNLQYVTIGERSCKPFSQKPFLKDHPPVNKTKVMCAYSRKPFRNTCFGDSGGPLVDKSTGLLVGVLSFGDKNCLRPYPTAFSRVSFYYDWIQRKVCANSAQPPASFGCGDSSSNGKDKGKSKGKGENSAKAISKGSKGKSTSSSKGFKGKKTTSKRTRRATKTIYSGRTEKA